MELWYLTLENLIQTPEVIPLRSKGFQNCITVDISEAALTCIDIWFKGGSSYEEKGEEGFAHFLEHMIFKGTSKLKEGEFDLKIEELGGSSNAATGYDDVHFYILWCITCNSIICFNRFTKN